MEDVKKMISVTSSILIIIAIIFFSYREYSTFREQNDWELVDGELVEVITYKKIKNIYEHYGVYIGELEGAEGQINLSNAYLSYRAKEDIPKEQLFFVNPDNVAEYHEPYSLLTVLICTVVYIFIGVFAWVTFNSFLELLISKN